MTETQFRDDVKLVALDDILPYGENPKEHPDEQVDKIASSIKRFGWDQPIVVDGDGEIIKGHGRYQAAKRLGLDEVPVIDAPDLSEAEVRAARIADNRVAESEWDDDLLAVEMDLIEDSPLDSEFTGFDDDEIDEFIGMNDEGPDDDDGVEYTDKIKSPVYEPTQDEAPPLKDLYDTGQYEDLLERVETADVSDDLQEFLRLAAQRHVIFDYENIAEYYAHAGPELQELMEALTLVIVDYDQAVEQGFVDFAEDALEGVNDA